MKSIFCHFFSSLYLVILSWPLCPCAYYPQQITPDRFSGLLQKKWPYEKATPVIAERGDVVIFSYLLVHGSTPNLSDRPRRMFLAQFAAADDKPIGDQRQQPGYGWVLRGANLDKDAATSKQFD